MFHHHDVFFYVFLTHRIPPFIPRISSKIFMGRGPRSKPPWSRDYLDSRQGAGSIVWGGREGYRRLLPLVSYPKIAFSPRGLPAPPFSSFCFISKNGIFTERVTGSTVFILLFHIQKRHFYREGYRLHLFIIVLNVQLYDIYASTRLVRGIHLNPLRIFGF